MTGGQPGVERRKNHRVEVNGATFVVLRPDYRNLGQVVDVGLGGLAFRYVSSPKAESRIESNMMDIFVVGNDFYLDNVSFETIWDSPTNRVVPWRPTNMRLRGVRFKGLTLPQRSKLDHLVESRFGMIGLT
jgi:hypothetical protein